MEPINETLQAREKTHGKFSDVASSYSALKQQMLLCKKRYDLTNEELMSLDMIIMKLSRILNANDRTDSWHDIAGYATLAEKSLGK